MEDTHPIIRNEWLDDLMPPRDIAFIVNPRSGTNLQKNIRAHVDKHLNHRRFRYGFKFTEHAGHATELAREAVAEGCQIVVAVGGDGSINEVATGLIGTEAALGIVPAGSGNGLAMHLGYGRDIEEAIKKINHAKPKTIDVGLLNGRPFVNLAGIGFDGLVSNLMKDSQWRGFIPYFLKSVKAGLEYKSRACRIELDDRVLEENCFTVTVANGPMYGYNVQIAPDARLDDGLFEVVVLKDAPRWQYFAAMPATLNGKIYDAEFVQHYTSKKVRITSSGENYIHLDGEGLKTSEPLEFEVKPNCLHILVPSPD